MTFSVASFILSVVPFMNCTQLLTLPIDFRLLSLNCLLSHLHVLSQLGVL